jgi:hypothetical protein
MGFGNRDNHLCHGFLAALGTNLSKFSALATGELQTAIDLDGTACDFPRSGIHFEA